LTSGVALPARALLGLLPISSAEAQLANSLPSLTITRADQLLSPEVWGKRYQSLTIDGVQARVPARAVLVANEVSGIRGGALVGSEFPIVARRLANLTIDGSGTRESGASAGTVRLYVKLVQNARVLANGAPGGAGRTGAPGANGADGSNGRDGNCDGFGAYR